MCTVHVHTPKCAVYWSNTGTALRCAEMDSGPVPLPNEKSLKEKKRKLEETLNGVVKYLVSQAKHAECGKDCFMIFTELEICCFVLMERLTCSC